MGKNEKLINKIESKPTRKDITPDELEKYLKIHGFESNRQVGSHKNYINKKAGLVFTVVVNKNPIKPCYVKDAVELVSCIKEDKDE